jgi:spermidine/putrescine transport system permease protein
VTRPLAWAYLLAAYAFILLPVAVLVLFSFQDGRLPVPPFQGVSLRWYADVLGDRDLVAALVNSALVGLLSSVLACALGFLAALGLARHALPGGAALRALLVMPLAVSTLIIGLGLLVVLNRLGLGPSLWAVGAGHVVINLPLCFAILYAAMGDQQRGAERAARDLGASEVRVIGLVTLPMLRAPLLAALFLSMTLSWDEFIIAFLLTRFDVTLPVEIFSLLRSGLSPRLNAVGSLVFLLSMAAVLVLELLVLARRRA